MAFDPPRTPLRRGSQRFLAESKPFISSTSSTGDRDGGSSTGLAALESAFQGIADEMEIFVRNVQEMERITEMLEESAESMAMFLQAQRMNTFCVEFRQVCLIPEIAAMVSGLCIWIASLWD
jgi:DASH complex subunit DAM1